MEDDWEALAEAKAEQLFAKTDVNKWAGEDEDDVKESWEDDEEEEEKKDQSKGDKSPDKNAKAKKTPQQKMLEKEKLKLEKERLRREEEAEASLTPEQRLAEKRRLQKLQEENDLKTAMETLGITSMASGGIDGMHPTTKEEFAELADAISKKLSNYRADPEYQGFLEDLLLKVFASLSSNSIRKAKTTLDNLYLEKQKVEKGDKPKKTKGIKVKARLRVEGENADLNEYATKYDDFDEYDDFM